MLCLNNGFLPDTLHTKRRDPKSKAREKEEGKVRKEHTCCAPCGMLFPMQRQSVSRAHRSAPKVFFVYDGHQGAEGRRAPFYFYVVESINR